MSRTCLLCHSGCLVKLFETVTSPSSKRFQITSLGGGGVVWNLEVPGSNPPPCRYLDLFSVVPSSTHRPRCLNSQLVSLPPVGILNSLLYLQYIFIYLQCPQFILFALQFWAIAISNYTKRQRRSEQIFKREKRFNPGLTLSAFRSTRPPGRYPGNGFIGFSGYTVFLCHLLRKPGGRQL